MSKLIDEVQVRISAMVGPGWNESDIDTVLAPLAEAVECWELIQELARGDGIRIEDYGDISDLDRWTVVTNAEEDAEVPTLYAALRAADEILKQEQRDE